MQKAMNVLDVLVVEDHLQDFILLEHYLKEEHIQVSLVRAKTFSEAGNILNSTNDFDIILLDLSLPDVLDSVQLIKDMVHLAKEIPVVVLTGYGKKQFGIESLSLGISDYLLKDELDGRQLQKSIFYSIERKKTEKQLKESETKYRTLFDLSPIPNFVLERENLKFLDVNESAITLYGYSREEFLTMNVRDLWLEEERELLEKRVIKAGIHEAFQFRLSHRKKNGEIITVELTSNPFEYSGKPARVTSIRDITANLKAEQDLLNSERRFKALVQDGSDLVTIMDEFGNLSYVSPSSECITGIPAEKLIKTNFFSLIYKEDVDLVNDHFKKIQQQKRIQIPAYRIINSEGEIRWIETIITDLTRDPAVEGIVANSRDITELVIQEKKLIQSLERYDIVAKATSDTVTDYNVKEDTMTYNEGIRTVFGYEPDQVNASGSWWIEKLHPEDREMVECKTAELYENGEGALQIEYRFRCADGTYKYVLDRSYLLKDDCGNPLRMLGSMQDITKMRNYIAAIEKHNKRLKEIAWTQSHVVRAPLARIMGLIDLLENFDNIENQSELLKHILESARELDGIIRKLTGKMEPECLTQLDAEGFNNR